jgi:phosphoserine aminotransferase
MASRLAWTAHRATVAANATRGADVRTQRHVSFNFGPGPGALPAEVMARAQAEFCDFDGTGLGALESTNLDMTGASHPGEPRSAVQAMMVRTEKKLRNLLNVPDTHRVLFMWGGAVGELPTRPFLVHFFTYLVYVYVSE